MEGMRIIKLNGKFGFVDQQGNEVVPPIYDKVENFKLNDGVISSTVTKNGAVTFIDKTGNENLSLKAKYDKNERINKYTKEDFHDGIAKVYLENISTNSEGDEVAIKKYGFIDKEGNEVIPVIYDNVGNFNEGLAWFFLNKKYGFINKQGKVIIQAIYDGAKDFSEGLAVVIKAGGISEGVTQRYSSNDYQQIERKHNAYGFIDKQGNLVIPCKFTSAESFKNGKATVFIPNEGNRTIDKQGKVTQ